MNIMEKENIIKEIPKTIALNETNTLKDEANNETSLGSPEWDDFWYKRKNRDYEAEEINIKDLIKRLFSTNKKIEQKNAKQKHKLRKINRKHIYDFLKLDFTNIKYIIPFLKNNKGLTFDYYVARQKPIIKRMIELINYKIQ